MFVLHDQTPGARNGQLLAFFRRVWGDVHGAVCVTEVVLVVTVLSLGLIIGICAIRHSVVQELGDVAVALESLDQTYVVTVGGVTSQFDDTITLIDEIGLPPGNLCTLVGSTEN